MFKVTGKFWIATLGEGASRDWNVFIWKGSNKFQIRLWPIFTIGKWGLSIVRKELPTPVEEGEKTT